MKLRHKYIRIFVSSTFSDMELERDYVRTVIDKLNKKYQADGWNIEYIDLRWGISPESSNDNQTMTICLNELDLCQRLSPRPNFILLMGERYGWRPLPERITPADFDKIIHRANKEERRLLSQWYFLDENDASNSYGTYHLHSRNEIATDDFTTDVEAKLRPLICRVCPHFNYSATELEAEHGIFDNDVDTDHIFAYIRTLGDLPAGKIDSMRDKGENHERQMRFRQKVSKSLSHENIYAEDGISWQDYCSDEFRDRFQNRLYSHLEVIIEREIEVSAPTPYDYEAFVQMNFAMTENASFIGRAYDIDYLKTYIDSNSPTLPLWICGDSGLGKTTLLAHIATIYDKRPDYCVVPVFCSLTQLSSDPLTMMQYVRWRLTGNLGEYHDFESFNPLKYASSLDRSKRYLIIIDAIDQLDGRKYAIFNSLHWITSREKQLPPNVRIIISSTPDSRFPHSSPLFNRYTPDNMKSDALAMVLFRLSKLQRRLSTSQTAQLEQILTHAECSAIYLSLLTAYLSTKTSSDDISDTPTSFDNLCRKLLERLSAPNMHGLWLTRRAMALIATASDGMGTTVIRDILALDKSIQEELSARSMHQWTDDGNASLPPIVWSRLAYDLTRSLIRTKASAVGLTITLRHAAITDFVLNRWLTPKDLQEAYSLQERFYSDCYLSGNLMALRDYFHVIVQGHLTHKPIDFNSFDNLLQRISTINRLHSIIFDARYIASKQEYFPSKIVN